MRKFLSLVLVFSLFLFLISPALAAKPDNPPGKGKNKDKPPPIPNSVCIDPGHGGGDIGASNGGLLEKNVNLEVANKLFVVLETAGYTVLQTRIDDSPLSNADRYNYCNSQNTAILISIHHNGSADPALDYSTALYMKKSDVDLARIVVNTVATQLELPNYGISRFASGVLLKSKMPATISEGFFLTNTGEAESINNSNRLDQESQALFAAIETYFATH